METRVKQVKGPTAIFKKIALISTLVIAIAAFLPWVSSEEFDLSKQGIEGDGLITLVLAVVAFFLILINKFKAYIPLVLLAVIAVIGVRDWYVTANTDVSGIVLNVETGLYLTVAATAVAAVSLIIHWIKKK